MWRAGMRLTEVRLAGWCDSGLGQHWNNCGGCAIVENSKVWRALVDMIEYYATIFAWPCVLSDHPPLLWWLSPGEGLEAVYMMR